MNSKSGSADKKRKRKSRPSGFPPIPEGAWIPPPPARTSKLANKYMVLWDFSVLDIHGIRGEVVEIKDQELVRSLKSHKPQLIRDLGSLQG